jgi:hypothetical protein
MSNTFEVFENLKMLEKHISSRLYFFFLSMLHQKGIPLFAHENV